MEKKEKINSLQQKANDIREQTLDMCVSARTGHVTSCFSCAELITTLYNGDILRYDAKNPKWEDRDRFILSKGQASPILYTVLGDRGFFPKEWCNDFCKKDGKFGVHLQCDVPGVEYTMGSLGHGLGIGAGVALAAKYNQKDYHTFVLLGDAECYEGSVWEAAMFASHYNLNNLTVIIDRNGYGVLGPTEDVVKLNELDKKFESFGWETKKIDGHSVKEIYDALSGFRSHKKDSPALIVAETVKGKGIKFMENVALWHGVAPIGDNAKRAKKELTDYTVGGEYE